ncbi:MAG: hypothetical protein ACYC8T_08360 [Myxococcaceae bacterium]
MRIGIDWVSAAILAVAFIFVQFRTVPARFRYAVLAMALGGIGAYRLRMGAVGPNLIIVGVAVAACVYYAYRAVKAHPKGR